jgi:hypothetical protein
MVCLVLRTDMEGVERREVRTLSSMPLFHFQVNTNINLDP